jgi:iron complex transport system substrate-binding protein
MNSPLNIDFPPDKIVSLVPSITESLFDLGLGKKVIGVTDYCVHPLEQVKNLPRVGGPKNINIDLIIKLEPDLVICNREENNEEEINQLISSHINVWITYPLTVRDALDDLWALAELYHSQYAIGVMKNLEASLEWMKLSVNEGDEFRYFCPIWRRVDNENKITWMTFNQKTYMSDLLSVWGGTNIFSDTENPDASTETGKRYFYVNIEQIAVAKPEVVILPNEPYLFTEIDRDEIFEGILNYPISQKGKIVMSDAYRNEFFEKIIKYQASQKIKFILLDGSLITWHGTRLARSLQTLPQLISN